MELLREETDRPLTVERIAERAEVAPATGLQPRWYARSDPGRARHQAFAGLEAHPPATDAEPLDRARATIETVVSTVMTDSAGFRALFSDWRPSTQLLDHDIAKEIGACLADAGLASSDVHRLSALVGAGLNGLFHQWAAGLIGYRQLLSRSLDLVELVFLPARAGF